MTDCGREEGATVSFSQLFLGGCLSSRKGGGLDLEVQSNHRTLETHHFPCCIHLKPHQVPNDPSPQPSPILPASSSDPNAIPRRPQPLRAPRPRSALLARALPPYQRHATLGEHWKTLELGTKLALNGMMATNHHAVVSTCTLPSCTSRCRLVLGGQFGGHLGVVHETVLLMRN